MSEPVEIIDAEPVEEQEEQLSESQKTNLIVKVIIAVVVLCIIAWIIELIISALTPSKGKDYIIRGCYETEVVCDKDCGRNIKTPSGKYCCFGSCL